MAGDTTSQTTRLSAVAAAYIAAGLLPMQILLMVTPHYAFGTPSPLLWLIHGALVALLVDQFFFSR